MAMLLTLTCSLITAAMVVGAVVQPKLPEGWTGAANDDHDR
jgi:hypothetical protein